MSFEYIGCCVELPAEFTTYVVDNSKEISSRRMKMLMPDYEEYNPYPGSIPLRKDYAVHFYVSRTPSGKKVILFIDFEARKPRHL